MLKKSISLVALVLSCMLALTGSSSVPAPGAWSPGGDMPEQRTGASALLLEDGSVFLSGGLAASGAATNAVWVRDPNGTWSTLPTAMQDARAYHTATMLDDGRILIAGGEGGGAPLSSLEIYDPFTGQFTSAGTLSVSRTRHAAAPLDDGRVLLIGGYDGTQTLSSSEFYDPNTGSIAPGPSLPGPRQGLSATTLWDGRVLIAGGNDGSRDLGSTLIYDPNTGNITPAQAMSTSRSQHTALLLPDNNSVLIAGGTSAGNDLASAELFRPWTGDFSSTGSLASPRSAAASTEVSQSGTVLTMGGSSLSSTESYSYATLVTDKDDYLPGEIVTITGTGWQPNEVVTLVLHELPTIDADVTLTATADGSGNISNSQFAPTAHDTAVRYYITAAGAGSGWSAQTSFWDPNSLDYTPSSYTNDPAVAPGGHFSFSASVTAPAAGSGAWRVIRPTGYPSGITVSFNPSTLTFTSGALTQSSTVTVNVGSGVAAGTYTGLQLKFNPGTGFAGEGPGVALTVVVGSAGPTKLAFTTSAVSGAVGDCLGPITVQTQDGSGTATNVTSDTSLSLSSTSSAGSFFSSSGCSSGTIITSVSVANGTNSATFYYKDGNAGTPAITVSSTGLTQAQQTESINAGSTTTTLTSSVNPSVFAQSVTFTATVAGVGTPGGTVTFSDGTTALGTGTLSGGKASFTTSTLSVATHSITASYAGDTNNSGSVSSALSQVVNMSATTTSLTSSPNPSNTGQSVTFTATVAATAPGTGTPTGSVTFLDGTTSIGTGTLNSSGVATLTTAGLSIGDHTITAQYNSDGNYAGSTSSGLKQTVKKIATTATLTSSANPSVYGQPVTLTATVAPVSGTGTPTGTVHFREGTTELGSGTLNGSGQATLQIGTLSVTTHSITAVYDGDSTFDTSTSTPLSQVVNKASTTSAVLTSKTPTVFGESVMFTATVSVVAPGAGTAAGTVTFMDGTTSLGTGSLNSSGQATLTTASLSVSSHSITAVYGESPNFLGSTSTAITQVVNKAQTTTALGSNLNPAVFGNTVRFAATVSAVSPGSGTATGYVQFSSAPVVSGVCSATTTPLGSGPLNNGSAYVDVSNSLAGRYCISASYGGNGNFYGSDSSTLTQVVDPYPATTVVTVSPTSQQYSDAVTFTATVSPAAVLGESPATTVTFMVGTQKIGSQALALDQTGTMLTASISAPLLEPTPFGTAPTGQMAPGSQTVTAVFSGGDTRDFTVTNATTPLTITKEDARVTFTGQTFYATGSGTSANIVLAATVKDISAVDSTETTPGDIRNARVRFVDRGNNNTTLCTAPVGLVGTDTTIGSASCSFTGSVGTSGATQYTVGTIVESYYTRNDSSDDVVVSVSQTGTGMVTGGGYLVLTQYASGQLIPAQGLNNNFGFNIKYNKSNTNLQGNINLILRTSTDFKTNGSCQDTHGVPVCVYQIKGNKMTSLTVNPTTGQAVFFGNATVQDITNPNATPISIDGGTSLKVTMTDKGEPGTQDTIAFTVFNNKQGGIWFSSRWDTGNGVTVEQLLSGGNLVVH